MSANPRKFSEKIALQQQKQAEGTAAYEQIMREVGATTRATRMAVIKPMQQKQEASNPVNVQVSETALKEGNVNSSINLKDVLMTLEDMKHSLVKPVSSQAGSPVTSYHRSHSPGQQLTSAGHQQQQQQHPKRKKFSADRHREFSPYGSSYLAAPDSSWRRVSSDSAIHATTHSNNPVNVQDPPANMASPLNAAALLVERNTRPRSCEMSSLGRNGVISSSSHMVYYPTNFFHNTLGIPLQTNQSSGSLPNLKATMQQQTGINFSANHHSAVAPHIHETAPSNDFRRINDRRSAPQMVSYVPLTIGCASMSGGSLVMPHAGARAGAVFVEAMLPPSSSYLESLYSAQQILPTVGSVPSQNAEYILQNQTNVMLTPGMVDQSAGTYHHDVEPPPYSFSKSSSLPPTSPPPAITLTDVESSGQPLETVLLESPAVELTGDMYSPSWERFLQSPNKNSLLKLTQETNSNESSNSFMTDAVYAKSLGLQHPLAMYNTGNMWSTQTNEMKPSLQQNLVNNHNNNITGDKIKGQFVNLLSEQQQEPPPPYGSIELNSNPSVQKQQRFFSDVCNPSPVPDSTTEPSLSQQTPSSSSSLFSGSTAKRNPLVKQVPVVDSNSSTSFLSELETWKDGSFPSLSCLGDSFDGMDFTNAEDLLKLDPLDIEDIQLLSSSACNVTNEEFFTLDESC